MTVNRRTTWKESEIFTEYNSIVLSPQIFATFSQKRDSALILTNMSYCKHHYRYSLSICSII